MNLTGARQVIGVEIRGEDLSLQTSLQRAGREVEKFTQKAGRDVDQFATKTGGDVDQFSRKAGQDIERFSQKATSDMEGFTTSAGAGINTLMALVRRFAGPAALALLGKQIGEIGIGFHDFSQQAEIGLTTMLGTAEAARSYLADVLTFAKETPHSFPDWTEQAQTLVSMGMAVEDTIPALRAAGDAAAGMSKGFEGVSGIVDILGTISTVGHITGVEITRLARAGVPALTILANRAGETAEVFRAQVADGAVEADWAIRNLVEGISEGTDGINGATVAFGGLMQEVKESGGWTPTLDSARSGFRNMSAAITESLLPALVELIKIGTEAMGWIQSAADLFNLLPNSLKLAAVGLVGLRFAMSRAAADTTLATTSFQSYRQQLQLARIEVGLAGGAFTGLRSRLTAGNAVMAASLARMTTAAKSAGSALLGAFGGPVGIAITGASIGVMALNKNINDTKQEIQELLTDVDPSDTTTFDGPREDLERMQTDLERTLGRIDDIRSFWGGLKLDPITNVWEHVDASKLNAVNEELAELDRKSMMTNLHLKMVANELGATVGEVEKVARDNKLDLTQELHSEEAIAAMEQLRELVISSGESAELAARGWAYFSDEQKKAVESAASAADSAFDSAFNLVKTFEQVVVTEEEVADARHKVEQATRRVRDAEKDLREEKKKDDGDIVRREESLVDARRDLTKATDELTDLEASRRPLADQLADHYRDTLEQARTFADQIKDATEAGVDPNYVAELIAAGPEKAGPQLEAMLSDHSGRLIEMANETYSQMEELNTRVVEAARLTQIAIESPTSEFADELPLAMRISAERETSRTVDEIAQKLGEDANKIRAVGEMYGMEWLRGFDMAFSFIDVTPVLPDGTEIKMNRGHVKGYAYGGVYPGYTPGRDIGLIGVSGGEAIMRPEWTRAVGPKFVDRMNAIARQGGVSAVKAAMAPFLGGFAMGGTVKPPQVVTVPVSSRTESHAPIHVGNLYVDSAADLAREAARRRADNSLVGRR